MKSIVYLTSDLLFNGLFRWFNASQWPVIECLPYTCYVISMSKFTPYSIDKNVQYIIYGNLLLPY